MRRTFFMLLTLCLLSVAPRVSAQSLNDNAGAFRARLGLGLGNDSGLALGIDIPAGNPLFPSFADQTFTIDAITGDDSSLTFSLMQWTQPVSQPTTGIYYGIGPALSLGDNGGPGLKLAAGQTIRGNIDIEAAVLVKSDTAVLVSAGFRF